VRPFTLVLVVLTEPAGIYLPGCAHAQQLIWQLFNSVEKGYQAAGDTDSAFLEGEISPPSFVSSASDLISRGDWKACADG
jgi:hypothetical protein